MALDLDLFRLSVFVAVVDRRGYSAAARHLRLAQSTVSHHVSELEKACNATLLHYEDRSIHLTAAGREVYQVATVMLTEQNRLAKSLGDLREGRVGRIRLGASMALEQKYFLTDVIAPFCRSNEGLMLSLRFGHSRREAQAVLDRELDLAYVINWDLPDAASFEVLHEAEFVFLVAPDHALAGRDSVPIREVERAGLISAPLTGAESSYYRDLLRTQGFTGDHTIVEMSGQQARLLLTAAGVGVMATFIPEYAREAVYETLTPLKVDGPVATVELGLVRRPGEAATPGSESLAVWLRELASR